jgi:hypothetical protein
MTSPSRPGSIDIISDFLEFLQPVDRPVEPAIRQPAWQQPEPDPAVGDDVACFRSPENEGIDDPARHWRYRKRAAPLARHIHAVQDRRIIRAVEARPQMRCYVPDRRLDGARLHHDQVHAVDQQFATQRIRERLQGMFRDGMRYHERMGIRPLKKTDADDPAGWPRFPTMQHRQEGMQQM